MRQGQDACTDVYLRPPDDIVSLDRWILKCNFALSPKNSFNPLGAIKA